MKSALRVGQKELRKAEEQCRIARHGAEQKESALRREALAGAPEFLRALQLAFRVYIVAKDASPDTPAARLARLLSPMYRTFVDPLAQQGQLEEAALELEAAGVAELEASLVRLSHTVLLVAEPGVLLLGPCRAELCEAAASGRRLLVAADSRTALQDLAGEALPEAAAAALEAAWQSRVQFHGSAADSFVAVSEALSGAIGLPDETISAIPLDLIRPLAQSPREVAAEAGHLALPDLSALSGAGLKTLRIEVNGPSGATMRHVAALLRGNRDLQHLVLRGVRPPDLPELSAALVGSGSKCGLRAVTLGIGAELPVAPLRGGRRLAIASDALRPLDADLLSRLLLANTSLQELEFGPAPLLKMKDLQALADAVAAHASLQRLNGLDLSAPPRRGGAAPFLQLPVGGDLDLSEKPIGTLGAIILAADLGLLAEASVERLSLKGCGIQDTGLSCLSEAMLPACNGVTELLLSGNGLTAGASTALAAALPTLSSLQRLDLSANALEDPGARALCKALRGGACPALRALLLDGNGIKVAGAQGIALALRITSNLTELSLQGNHIGEDGAKAIAMSLQESGCGLQALHLNNNHSIGREGCRHLSASLAGNCALTHLGLSNNHVGEVGAAALVEGLRKNTALLTLQLAQCKLKAKGMAHIADALSANSSLQTLSLAKNSGGDQGVFALCGALARDNRSLQELDLFSNTITPAGAKALREMLRDNTALQQLHLGGNSLEPATCEELQALCSSQRKGRVKAAASGVLPIPQQSRPQPPPPPSAAAKAMPRAEALPPEDTALSSHRQNLQYDLEETHRSGASATLHTGGPSEVQRIAPPRPSRHNWNINLNYSPAKKPPVPE
mmetsp:Transcript_26373/g.74211  ORF Transcript_26373/g.74211 Transcript_26373/m.74211 type:complete len:853 (+) Transcript_26373:181-2739(+)